MKHTTCKIENIYMYRVLFLSQREKELCINYYKERGFDILRDSQPLSAYNLTKGYVSSVLIPRKQVQNNQTVDEVYVELKTIELERYTKIKEHCCQQDFIMYSKVAMGVSLEQAEYYLRDKQGFQITKTEKFDESLYLIYCADGYACGKYSVDSGMLEMSRLKKGRTYRKQNMLTAKDIEEMQLADK